MQRTLASANPVFRSLTLNDSIAFATMHVSNWRKASSSASVNKGSTGMPVSFRDPDHIHNAKVSLPRSKSCKTHPDRRLAAALNGQIRSVKPVSSHTALTVNVFMREIQRMEEDDCKGFLQKEDWGSEARPAQFGDKNSAFAEDRSRSPGASSRLHLWQDAAVSPRGMCGSGPC